MHPLVQEYRGLPPSSDHLGDIDLNYRKCDILRELDEEANVPEVSQLLLDVLADRLEYDLARVEALQVVGIYINERNPLLQELRAKVRRIARDEGEDEMIRGWAEQNAK